MVNITVLSISFLNGPVGTVLQGPVECRRWDDRFITTFHTSLVVGVAVWALILLWPLFFPPKRWWMTRPFLRVTLASLAGSALTIAIVVVAVLSSTKAPEAISVLGLPVDYVLGCPDTGFGGRGLLWGIGIEDTAVLQHFAMAAIAGGLFAVIEVLGIGLTFLLARRLSPLRLMNPEPR